VSNKTGKSKNAIKPIFRSVSSGGVGMAPGTPTYIGDRVPVEATYSLIQYREDAISIVTPDSIEEVILMDDPDMVNWINVNGIANQKDYKRLCSFLKLDPLTMEDMMNTEHRPKVEDFSHYLLVIAKMLTKQQYRPVEYEQISFILTENTLVTFQEAPGDCFGPVRERLKTGTGKLRRMGPDYLLYALLDVIVDNYFMVLEDFGTRLEDFEDSSMSPREARDFMAGLQNVKRELNHMRRVIWPVRDTVNTLLHIESELVDESLAPYMRDLYENTIQVIEALESYRETSSGIQEVFLSSLSNRMNEVMKVLTIISTIFIPLTFIVGVYGMNFDHMPELRATWGYPAVWGLMVAIAAGLMIFFKRKKWM
jgi:magnesium transporter